MRVLLPPAAALLVLVALLPVLSVSQEDGPTTSRSLLLPLPWGDGADTWGYAVAVGASLVTFVLGRRLLRRDPTGR
jgi:hypothetical protein